jgi:hypothetical protein
MLKVYLIKGKSSNLTYSPMKMSMDVLQSYPLRRAHALEREEFMQTESV